MKLVRYSAGVVAAITLSAVSVHAQPLGEGDASYRSTVIVSGPEAIKLNAAAKKSPAGRPELTHDIPTIHDDYDGVAREDVNYLTGGIGEDERAAIEASKKDYNVHVTNARVDGAFVGDTHIVIREKAGMKEEMLEVNAGPLLYVQLPEGSYVLEASYGEQTKTQSFVIGKAKKSATVNLGWKKPAPVVSE